MKKPLPSEQNPSPYAFLSLGLEFILIFLLLAGSGWLYDLHAGSGRAGMATLLGTFGGFILGTWYLHRRAQALGTPQKKTEVKMDNKKDLRHLSLEIEKLSKKMQATIKNKRKGS